MNLTPDEQERLAAMAYGQKLAAGAQPNPFAMPRRTERGEMPAATGEAPPVESPPYQVRGHNGQVLDASYVNAADSGVGYTPPAPAAAPGGGGGGVAVPAHWEPHSRATTVQTGVQFSPETRQSLDASEAHARKAAAMGADAEIASNQQEARLLKLQAGQLDAEAASEEIRKNHQDNQLARQNIELNSEIDRVREMRVDPARWWKGKGTAGQIGIALAMGLRDAGAALQGRDGGGLAWIQSKMDRDIDEQRADIAEGRAKIADQKGIYDQMLRRFGNEDQAALAARMAAREHLAIQIKAEQTASRDPIIRANAEKSLAAIERENAMLRGKFDEAGATRMSTSGQEVYHSAAVLGGGGGSAALKKGDLEGQKYISEKEAQYGIPDAEAALDNAQRLFNEVGKGHGATGFNLYANSPRAYAMAPGVTPKDVEYKQALQQAQNEFIHTMTGAGMGESEAKRYSNTTLGDHSPAAIQNGLRIMRDKVNAAKANIRAGASEKGAAAYDERRAAERGGAPAGPARTPPGFTPLGGR